MLQFSKSLISRKNEVYVVVVVVVVFNKISLGPIAIFR